MLRTYRNFTSFGCEYVSFEKLPVNFLFSGSEVFSAGVNIFRFVLVPTAVNSFAFLKGC